MADNLNLTHFRWRTDSGAADADPTWAANEDVAFDPGAANARLRVGVENTGDATGAVPWALYVDKNGGGYNPVTTTSLYARSVDAGSDADETAIMLRRLGLGIPDWWLLDFAIDLDLSEDQYYEKQPSPYEFLSCSRASVGYAKNADGTLTSFGNDTLRIGVGTGLLVEDSRENIAGYSNDTSNAKWDVLGTAKTSTNNTAPDGTSTAALVTEDSAAGFHRIINDMSAGTGSTANAVYSYSIFVKNGTTNGRRYIAVIAWDSGAADSYGAVLDTVNGTITDTHSGTSPISPSYSVEAFGSGWYRVTIIMTNSAGTGDLYIGAAGSNSATPTWETNHPTYTGDGVSNFYVWGSQIEIGSFSSSFIPTTTAAATRASDQISIIGNLSTLVKSNTASIVADIIRPVFATGDNSYVVGEFTFFAFALAASYNENAYQNIGDVGNHAALGTGTWETGAKLGSAWSVAGGIAVVAGGGTVATEPYTTNPIVTPELGKCNSVLFYGYLRRVTFWNSRLADATLQTYTDPAHTIDFDTDAATIDLDFAGGIYQYRPQATDFLSCSRASVGYAKNADGTLTSFGTDTLRITDLGLLVEDLRTNALTYSQAFSTVGAWTSGAINLDNQTTAPDGTSTGASYIPTSVQVDVGWGFLHDVTVTSGVGAFSMFFKNAGYNFAWLMWYDFSTTGQYTAIVNLTTGAITATHSGGTTSSPFSAAEVYGNGWVRLTVGQTFPGADTCRIYAGMHNNGAPTVWDASNIPVIDGANDGVSGIYMWGAQVEAGAFASSYVPTSTTSATRAADDIRCIGNLSSILMGATKTATVLIDYDLLPNAFVNDMMVVSTVYNLFAGAVGGAVNNFCSGGDSNLAAAFGNSLTWDDNIKGAVAYDNGAPSRSICGAGGSVSSDAHAFPTATIMALGGQPGQASASFGYFKRFTAWNSRLADATLQALTAP